jgi:hypothetical protein
MKLSKSTPTSVLIVPFATSRVTVRDRFATAVRGMTDAMVASGAG